MSANRSYRRWFLAIGIVAVIALLGGAYLEKWVLPAAVTTHVQITPECKVLFDTDTHLLDTVIWDPPDSHHYTLHFPGKVPFIDASSSGFVPAGKPEVVFGDLECNSQFLKSHPHLDKCYFVYEVFKDGEKCHDPGVHVGPPKYFTD